MTLEGSRTGPGTFSGAMLRDAVDSGLENDTAAGTYWMPHSLDATFTSAVSELNWMQ
jgi:hypothetical protein